MDIPKGNFSKITTGDKHIFISWVSLEYKNIILCFLKLMLPNSLLCPHVINSKSALPFLNSIFYCQVKPSSDKVFLTSCPTERISSSNFVFVKYCELEFLVF